VRWGATAGRESHLHSINESGTTAQVLRESYQTLCSDDYGTEDNMSLMQLAELGPDVGYTSVDEDAP